MRNTNLIIGFIALAILLVLLYMNLPQGYSCPDCNVIIIAFDAVQTSHVSAYGYPLQTTPNLNNFAKGGTLFTNAISPASWTVPTYMSWFTSMYPSEHKVVNRYSEYEPPNVTILANLRNLTPSAVTLAEIMKQNGFSTVAFTGDAGARGASGDNIGFDVYVDTPIGFNGFDLSVPMALSWIRNNTDKKFFMFLHGYDSHGQYMPKNFTKKYDLNYTGRFNGTVVEQAALREEGLAKGYVNVTDDEIKFWRAWYDEKINDADARFRIFINGLNEMGLMDKTIIIVASDHGTEFFEHGRVDHGHTLYQELIHVPLVVRIPNYYNGKTVTSQVSTLDIMPTIFQIAGIQVNDTVKTQIKGFSLLDAMKGKDVSRDVYSETDYRLFTHKRAIVTKDGWKFILTLAEAPDKKNVKELYNLKTDPMETTNLINSEPQTAYELEQKLLSHLKEMGTNIDGPWVIGCSAVYVDQCKYYAHG